MSQYVEFLTILLYIMIWVLLTGSESGLSILILSELCWAIIYSLYCIIGLSTNSLYIVSMSLPILILASVDAGIWIMILVYFNYYRSMSSAVSGFASFKFMFRVRRLLTSNRLIK